MAGIYIHVPFCKQACTYCNFHFSTSLRFKAEVLDAMVSEIAARRNFFPANTVVTSVYLGGGTPSLLSADDLNLLFKQLNENFSIGAEAEITLEANPDDLTHNTLESLSKSLVNRLSIGLQSFLNRDLQFMNRAHSANEAMEAIKMAQAAGFDNINADLIYGTPSMSLDEWKQNLEILESLNVQHLSAYQLTIEDKTALAHQVKKGQVVPASDDHVLAQFDYLKEWAFQTGFEHYEISNLAKPGFRAKHNSSYWHGEPYLGIGPSSHSFNRHARMWNIANNLQYRSAIEAGKLAIAAQENLTDQDKYNERVMTGLRLLEGFRLDALDEIDPKYSETFIQSAQHHLDSGALELVDGRARLTSKGRNIADLIASDCFLINS